MERSSANPRSIAVLVLVVLAAYVLSIGPATVLVAHNPGMQRYTRWVYIPLEALPEPANAALIYYVYWWVDITATQFDT